MVKRIILDFTNCIVRIFQKVNIVYPITIAISIGLILFSFVPYGWKVWENILVSIGCSGIAAALMAIFLDINSERKEKRRRKELRNIFLSGLNCEFKHLFERFLWFNENMDKIDMTKELKHYLSLDFIQESHFNVPPRYTSLKECANEIEQVSKKYEIEQLKQLNPETNNKIQKMFLIIGTASMPLLTELDTIRKNEMYLISNNIFTPEELGDIYISIGEHINLLTTPKSSYGAALSFLLYGYKKVYEWGHYDNDIMVISWQYSKSPLELFIEKRKQEAAVPTTTPTKTSKKSKGKRKKRK